MKLNKRKYSYENEEGEQIEVDLPGKWEICLACHGEGQSSAYLGAITESDRSAWSRDEMDDYFAGVYDRKCEQCEGGKVWEIDWERLPKEVAEHLEAKARYEAEDRKAFEMGY